MAKTSNSLALELMQKSKSVKERAESYFDSIKRNLQRDIIDRLVEKKEKLTDEIFELSNFNLDTNLNAGVHGATRETCEKRLTQLIHAEYELELITLELKSKQDIYNKYFN
jgi:hypothetical protein